MTKKYTIKGESTVRPEGLPDGFEVEETDDGNFERVVSVDRPHSVFTALLESGSMTDPNGVRLSLRCGGEPAASSRLWFNRDGAGALRDALTEFLGDAAPSGPPAVVRLGDPEPPRDAVYVDRDGDVWKYYPGNGWGFASGRYEWVEIRSCFPWKLKTA